MLYSIVLSELPALEGFIMNKIARLSPSSAALAVIDMQESFRPAIADFSDVASRIGLAVHAARLLELSVIITEQYPKGLKHTAAEISAHVPAGAEPLPKLCFSATGADGFSQWLESKNIRQVLICGIEAHICVAQTSLDLLEMNYEVFFQTCVH